MSDDTKGLFLLFLLGVLAVTLYAIGTSAPTSCFGQRCDPAECSRNRVVAQ